MNSDSRIIYTAERRSDRDCELQESISDMNNLNVSTILSDSYSEYFGFTHEEVEEA